MTSQKLWNKDNTLQNSVLYYYIVTAILDSTLSNTCQSNILLYPYTSLYYLLYSLT